MKLTKRQRNLVYKDTLKRFNEKISKFICTNLAKIVLEKYHFYPDQHQIEYDFPELLKFKPKKFPTQGSMWWVERNRNKRIEVLKACIKETNPKPKKN